MKITARVILIVIVILAASLACISGGGGGPTGADITATYGAELFHAQLTAQAGAVKPQE